MAAMKTLREKLADDEVVGVEADGGIIQWDAATQTAYNSGETVAEFGADNLTAVERNRLTPIE